MKSLRQQSYPYIEIILVDNGSKDGSVEFVEKNFSEVQLLVNQKNEGFAANNQAIQFSKGNYVLILNNDTILDSKMIEECVCVMEQDQRFGMGAPKVLMFDDHHVLDSIGLNIYPDGMTRQKGRLEKDLGQYDFDTEILLPSGCAAFYKKEMLDEIGLLDEDFFAYCEDSDLGFRGRLAGWKAISVPKSRVYHVFSGYWGKISTSKAFFVERNHIWFAIKCFPLKILLKLPFYTLYRFIVQIYGIILGQGMGAKFVHEGPGFFRLLLILFKAYFQAFRGLPKMLSKRKKIQENIKVSQKEINSWFKKYRLKIQDLILKD